MLESKITTRRFDRWYSKSLSIMAQPGIGDSLMKYKPHLLLLFLFLSILVFSASLYAQTNCYKLPKENKSAVFSLKFMDSKIGWACGNNGRILSAEDGGINWTRKRRQEKQSLNAIDFISPQIGIAVGFDWPKWSGIILKTSDSGATWKEVFTIKNIVLNDVCSEDSKTFWISAEKGLMLKSDDAGGTWRKVKIGSDNPCLETLFFVNKDTGWAAGSIFNGKDKAAIFKTTDGGMNWNEEIYQELSWIQSLYFLNSSTGYALGWINDVDNNITKSIILKTKDGGISWLPVATNIKGRLYAFDFYDATAGLAVGYDYRKNQSIMLKTDDGGETWTLLNIHSGTVFYDVAFNVKNAGWIAGGDGMFQITIERMGRLDIRKYLSQRK